MAAKEFKDASSEFREELEMEPVYVVVTVMVIVLCSGCLKIAALDSDEIVYS
jgi:hypothetical protein